MTHTNTKSYTATQPRLMGGETYLWNRFASVDDAVLMSSAQYTRSCAQNSLMFQNLDGSPLKISLPVSRPAQTSSMLEVTCPDFGAWKDKFLKTVHGLFARSEFYEENREWLHSTLESMGPESIGVFNSNMVRAIAKRLRLDTVFHDDKRVVRERPPSASEWLALMGFELECGTYLGGAGAQHAYVQEEAFSKWGVEQEAQQWKMAPYNRYRNVMGDPTACILQPMLVLGVEHTRYLIGA